MCEPEKCPWSLVCEHDMTDRQVTTHQTFQQSNGSVEVVHISQQSIQRVVRPACANVKQICSVRSMKECTKPMQDNSGSMSRVCK